MGRGDDSRVDSNRGRPAGRRTVRLVLQPYRDRTDWILTRRSWRGAEHSDHLLARGSLTYTEGRLAPRDVIADLRRIAFELERTHGAPRPEGAPEPPEGATGGQHFLPGLQPRDWTVSHDGGALDAGPSHG